MIQAPPARSLLAEGEWPMLFAGTAVILASAALISIWMSRAHSRRSKVVWTVATLLLPIVGPIAWFALGRQRTRHPDGVG